jgi:hypothetical protein
MGQRHRPPHLQKNRLKLEKRTRSEHTVVLVPVHPPNVQHPITYFNFALGPEASSAAAKDMLPAKDDTTLEDIAASFEQLYHAIKTAGANGDGAPLACSTPPTLWLAVCPSHAEFDMKKEHAKLGISDRPVHLQQSAHRGRERGNTHTDKLPHNNSGSNNRGGSTGEDPTE